MKQREIARARRSAIATTSIRVACSSAFAQNADDPLADLPISVTPTFLPPLAEVTLYGLQVCYLDDLGEPICKEGPPKRRSVNYYTVQPGTLAWQAQIYVPSVGGNWRKQHRWGGSAIGHGWFITAAHFKRDGAGAMHDVRARLGAFDLAKGDGAVYKIDRVVVHAGFKRGTKPHDIALLHIVPEQAGYGLVYRIGAIRLARPDAQGFEPLQIGGQVRTSGWGRTRYRGELRDTLGETKLNLKANMECRQIYGERFSDRALFVYAPDTDSCEGDSGGPLTICHEPEYRRLIGIVSFGRRCAVRGAPEVYTRVDACYHWIQAAKRQTQNFARLDDPVMRQAAR